MRERSLTELDVSHLTCPLTWVKTKLALERLEPGDTLRVRCAPDSEALVDVPGSAARAGHGVRVLTGEPIVEITKC